jgi:hypothetical protein
MPGGAPCEWLHQEWVHSHEEDQGDDMVFRPASFKLPPSRGRRSIELHSDGTLGHARPGPADRPERGQGRWEIDGDQLRLFRASGPAPAEVLRIAHAAPDRLVLRRT